MILEFLLLLIGNFYLHFRLRFELDKMDEAESKAELGIEKKGPSSAGRCARSLRNLEMPTEIYH